MELATSTRTAVDVAAIPDLKDLYENHTSTISGDQEQVSERADQYREVATSFDSIAANLSAEEFDSSTVGETEAVREAYTQAADKATELAAVLNVLEGALADASRGLRRHDAMVAAVNGSGHVAKSTASYAPR